MTDSTLEQRLHQIAAAMLEPYSPPGSDEVGEHGAALLDVIEQHADLKEAVEVALVARVYGAPGDEVADA